MAMPIIARDPNPRDPKTDVWLKEARSLLDTLDHDALSEWEQEFIDSLEMKWLPEGRISEKQIERLRTIGERSGDGDDQRRSYRDDY